jgi:Cu(I)/Ag(I) efflux system membrane fusion protein
MKIIWITILALLLFACNNKKQEIANENTAKEKIVNDSMANMPGMDDVKNDEIKLSDQQVQLGNILSDTINSSMLGDQIILTATLNIDQMKTTSISARVMGRIEKLYFKNIGDHVNKGDRLFDLYSEELNNAKQELVLALERKSTLDNSLIDFDRLIQSAKYKLMLWGMSDTQIDDLVKTRKATPTTTFYSNASGFITTLDLKEGESTMEGSTVIRLADLSTVWAEAQVYSTQLSQIDRSGIAEVQVPDIPGKKINGKIEFVNPEINPDTRINLIRVNIPNPGNQLKPGMPAYLILKNRQHNMLSLPIDAVIRDGKGATVWLQTGKNMYKNQMVETGMETGERIEIRSGIKAGDVVVTRGAYLLNSEYIFKNGANPMAGMKM